MARNRFQGVLESVRNAGHQTARKLIKNWGRISIFPQFIAENRKKKFLRFYYGTGAYRVACDACDAISFAERGVMARFGRAHMESVLARRMRVARVQCDAPNRVI